MSTKEKTKAQTGEATVLDVKTDNPEGFDAAAYQKGEVEVEAVLDQAKGTKVTFTVINS